jgi:hypothetical protein
MTTLLHHFPNEDCVRCRVREAELEYLFASPLAQRVLAENYVGLAVVGHSAAVRFLIAPSTSIAVCSISGEADPRLSPWPSPMTNGWRTAP